MPAGARGVAAVALSSCKRYVACADLANVHNVSVYNISRKKQLFTTEGGKEKILDLVWSKRPDDLRFVTQTLKTVNFWHPADVTKKITQKGTFGTKHAMTNFGCVCFDEEGWFYTGGENGIINVWSDACQVVKSIKAHASGITAIHADGSKLFSGGKDRKVAIISI